MHRLTLPPPNHANPKETNKATNTSTLPDTSERASLPTHKNVPLLFPVAGHFKMVGETGFEPATSASQTQRSTKLSYSPILGCLHRAYFAVTWSLLRCGGNLHASADYCKLSFAIKRILFHPLIDRSATATAHHFHPQSLTSDDSKFHNHNRARQFHLGLALVKQFQTTQNMSDIEFFPFPL